MTIYDKLAKEYYDRIFYYENEIKERYPKYEIIYLREFLKNGV